MTTYQESIAIELSEISVDFLKRYTWSDEFGMTGLEYLVDEKTQDCDNIDDLIDLVLKAIDQVCGLTYSIIKMVVETIKESVVF